MRSTLLACLALVSCSGARPMPAGVPLQGVAARGLDGKTVRIENLRGRVVLIDFWATWCDPCRESLPFYADLQRELGPKGLTIAAISIDADDDPVREYFKMPPPFLVLRDPDGSLAERMGVSIMPTSFLLDRSGVTREKLQGFKAEEKESVRARIAALLQEAPR
jgi:cytochrome c biogenesis protein CcmG/thiol:disulfide interchange protein DsbE